MKFLPFRNVNKLRYKCRQFSPFSKKSFYNTLTILFILIAFSYTCIRAYLLSMTHDEAITYLNHASGTFFEIFTYARPIMSNNHLLNTILIKIFTNLFGTSEFVIRIPALIGHGLYLVGVYKIINLFLRGRFILLGTCLLICHPLMLDLFSCARGFSLGLGFLIFGLYYFFKGIKGSELGQHLKDNVFGSIMLALSTLSHLAFLNVFLSVMVVFLLSELITLFKKGPSMNLVSREYGYKRVFFTVVPSSLFLLMIYTYPVVKMMRAGSEFTHGGINGFWEDTITSLIGVTLYQPFLNSNIILFAKLLIILILLFSFLISLYDWLMKREFELVTKYLVWLVLTLLVCSFSVILQHFIFGIKYPIDRYAIYLIPIFFLLILVYWQDIRFTRSKLIRIPVNSLFYLIIIILLINSINRINFTHFYQWKYDASTKDAIEYIIRVNQEKKLEDNSIKLGIDWIFEPSINFYKKKNGLKWLARVDPDPDGEFDYYYVTAPDIGLKDKYELKLIKRYNLSDTYLLTWGSAAKRYCIEFVPLDHWKGEYFDNKALSGAPLRVRDDGAEFINFEWAGGSPGTRCGIGSDNFSVRWTRKIYFNGGTYYFTVTTDDGFRLFVDNRLVLDKWFDQPPTTYIVDVPLSAGNHTIRMEYYQATGQAVASLSWKMK